MKSKGRTRKAVSYPRKFKPFSSLDSKKQFQELWNKRPHAILAQSAHAAYHQPSEIENIYNTYGATIKTFMSQPDKLGVIYGRFAFLAIWEDKVILSFRGTVPDKRLRLRVPDRVRSIAKALHIEMPQQIKTPIATNIVDDISFIKTPFKADNKQISVHLGFFKATKDLWSDIYKELEQLKHLPIYVTGHSLGAAMAVIAALQYDFEEIVTFGEPAVGTKIELFIPVEKHTRYINGADPVPELIPSFLYQHHGVVKKIKDESGEDFRYDHSIVNYAHILTHQIEKPL